MLFKISISVSPLFQFNQHQKILLYIAEKEKGNNLIINSNRMRSTTSKIATAFDVNVVVASCLFGVISGSFGYRQMQEVNRRLKEVRLSGF